MGREAQQMSTSLVRASTTLHSLALALIATQLWRDSVHCTSTRLDLTDSLLTDPLTDYHSIVSGLAFA